MLCNTVTLRFNGAEHWCWSLTPNRRRAFVSTSLPASFQDCDTIDLGNRKGSGDRACSGLIAFRQLAGDMCDDRTWNVRLAVDFDLENERKHCRLWRTRGLRR